MCLLQSTECEQELQWLKEAGFDTIVKKYRGNNMLTNFSLVFAEKSVQNITVVITLYCIFYRLSIMVSGLGDGQNADP